MGAIMVAIGFYYFSYFFPYQHKKLSKSLNTVVILITLSIAVSLFIKNAFFESIVFSDKYTAVESGIMFHAFNIYFLVLMALGIYNFILKYKVADGLHHWQIKNVFYAVSIALIAGVATNLIMPWIFDIWTVGLVGPMFSIVFFGFLSYILFKK